MDELSDLTALSEVVRAYALIAILPGANFIVVSQSGLSASRSAALLSAIGVSAGAALVAAVALAGGGAAIAASGTAWLLNLAFASLMAFLGARLITGGAAYPALPAQVQALSGSSCFRLGLMTACSNPITLAFFVGLAGTAGCRMSGCEPVQSSVAVFVTAFSWFALVAFGFSLSAVRRIYGRVRRSADVFLGLMLFVLAGRAVLDAAVG